MVRNRIENQINAKNEKKMKKKGIDANTSDAGIAGSVPHLPLHLTSMGGT